MDIRLKRFDKSLPIPEYKTKGAAGIDLYAREDVAIEAGIVGRVPLNIAVEIPEGYVGIVTARSSLHKLGLIPINGVGIIDSDYCGDEDELTALLYNFSKDTVLVEKGMRVVQLIIIAIPHMALYEVVSLANPNRGGFGSTKLR